MKINLDHYKLSKKFIQEWFLLKSRDNPEYAVSLLSISTHVPCIVVAFYIGEINGWTKEILDIIERLIIFYKYTEILGIPDEFPRKCL